MMSDSNWTELRCSDERFYKIFWEREGEGNWEKVMVMADDDNYSNIGHPDVVVTV